MILCFLLSQQHPPSLRRHITLSSPASPLAHICPLRARRCHYQQTATALGSEFSASDSSRFLLILRALTYAAYSTPTTNSTRTPHCASSPIPLLQARWALPPQSFPPCPEVGWSCFMISLRHLLKHNHTAYLFVYSV